MGKLGKNSRCSILSRVEDIGIVPLSIQYWIARQILIWMIECELIRCTHIQAKIDACDRTRSCTKYYQYSCCIGCTCIISRPFYLVGTINCIFPVPTPIIIIRRVIALSYIVFLKSLWEHNLTLHQMKE